MYTIGERKNNKYLKEIDISILTDSIMEKYSKQLDYCNLDKEALGGNIMIEKDGFIMEKVRSIVLIYRLKNL